MATTVGGAELVCLLVESPTGSLLFWGVFAGERLHPEKINSYAAAVVRKLRAEDNQLGIVAEDDLQPGNPMFKDMPPMSEEDEPIVLKAMHQTFVDRGLCIRQPTENGNQLVFPAFFGVNRPAQPELPPLMVTYDFAGFLDDVYATLVVRLHHTPAFQTPQDRLFRDYAEFLTANGSPAIAKKNRLRCRHQPPPLRRRGLRSCVIQSYERGLCMYIQYSCNKDNLCEKGSRYGVVMRE